MQIRHTPKAVNPIIIHLPFCFSFLTGRTQNHATEISSDGSRHLKSTLHPYECKVYLWK